MPPLIRHRQLLDPRSFREALAMRRDEESLMPIAGCTDVYVSLNFGTLKQTRFMNLWRLKELRGVDRRGGRLRIGALTTYTELIRSPLVSRALPMLVWAAREIGGRQIQHRGTIGGNVANASPAGDTLPCWRLPMRWSSWQAHMEHVRSPSHRSTPATGRLSPA